MKRKVNLVGQNTLTISLPSKWARKYDIKKGNELEMDERGNIIILSTTSDTRTPKRLEIEIKRNEDFLKRFICGPYWRGYDEIYIKFEDKEVINSIQDNVNNLLGFEIIKQGKDFCILGNIAGEIYKEFDSILNRLMLVNINQFKELYEYLSKNEFSKLSNILSIEQTIDRLAYFCKRILNINGYSEPTKTCDIYLIVSILEAISDNLKDIAELVDKRKIRLHHNTLEILKKLIEQQDDFYRLFDKYDRKSIVIFKKKRMEIVKECINNEDKMKKEEAIVTSILRTIAYQQHHLIDCTF